MRRKQMKIGVVIVTYNRLEKLKKCLSAYERQAFLPVFLHIVDNCSTDGSGSFLDAWADTPDPFQKSVFHSNVNLGGAGGFSLGIGQALSKGADWIWISDDDAYPDPDCLQKLSDYYTALPSAERSSIAGLCAKVRCPGGVSYLHRRRLRRSLLQLKEVPLRDADYINAVNDIDFFSFVGTAVRSSVIARAGLPNADYFINYDDSEYSLRCRKYGILRCLSDAAILHDSPEDTIPPKNWKNYYAFRNKLYTYRQYFGRWYCFVEYLKHIYMILRHYNNFQTWKQFLQASIDACKGHLGQSSRTFFS